MAGRGEFDPAGRVRNPAFNPLAVSSDLNGPVQGQVADFIAQPNGRNKEFFRPSPPPGRVARPFLDGNVDRRAARPYDGQRRSQRPLEAFSR